MNYNAYLDRKGSSPYEDLLDTIEWQIKRKIILNRDNFICTNCSSSDNLHVHHLYYIWGSKPWEYDDNALITLCKNCHQDINHYKDIKWKVYVNEDIGNLFLEELYYLDEFFTKCSRCKGIGYFDQFKDIQNGICFRCKGLMYDEIIDQQKYLKGLSIPLFPNELFKNKKWPIKEDFEQKKKEIETRGFRESKTAVSQRTVRVFYNKYGTIENILYQGKKMSLKEYNIVKNQK